MMESKGPCHVCGSHTGQSCTLCGRPTCEPHIYRHHCHAHRYINPDETALLRTIRMNPDDDAPRLIHADYLEENGLDGLRHNFIRNDVAAFRDGLVAENPNAWLNGSHPWAHLWKGMETPQRATTIPVVHPYTDWGLRRGYIERVHTSVLGWTKHGPHLLYRNPIMDVFIVDRRPHGSPTRGGCSWMRSGMNSPASLPRDWWQLLPGGSHSTYGELSKTYRSYDTAYRALSIAVLHWAIAELEDAMHVEFFLSALRTHYELLDSVILPRTSQSSLPHPPGSDE